MGITIHYQGQIQNRAAIYQLIDEVEEIAKTQDWPYTILDEDWNLEPTARLESAEEPGIQIVGHTGLKGLRFTPHPESEPVWLFFDKSGILTTPFRVALDAEEGYPQRKTWISTKTKYADVTTHVKIINLFRYLKKRYFQDLKVRDESGFWDKEDLNRLKRYYTNETVI